MLHCLPGEPKGKAMEDLQQQQPNEGKKKGRGAGHDDDRQIKKPRRSSSPSRIPPQVLKVVAASRFLTSKELGRLLLLSSSKDLTASAFSSPDEVWKSLCCSHWGTEQGTALLTSLVPVVLSSAEQCFRKFAADAPPVYAEPRALRYAPGDYVLFVSVRDHKKNQSIFCKALPGSEIPEFFQKGSLVFKLDRMFAKKTIENAFDADGEVAISHFERAASCLYEDLELELSVRILRYPDQKMIELAKMIKKRFRFDAWMDSNNELCTDAWCIGEESLADPHLNATYGSFLLRRCFSSDGCSKIVFKMKPDFRLLANHESGNICDGAVGIVGFKLSTHFKDESDHYYWCGEELEGKDVTLAHFLEALDVWFLP